MDIVYLIVLSVVLFLGAQFIEQKTNIAKPIIYLVVGILFGVGGLSLLNPSFYILTNPSIFPHGSTYSTMVLYLMFMGAGFSFQLKKKSKEKKKDESLKMGIVPVFIEALLMTGIFYGLTKIIALPVEVSLAETIIIVSLLAMASPATIIPITLGHIEQGRVGKDNFCEQLIVASLLNNNVVLPALLIVIILGFGPQLGFHSDPIMTLLIAVLVLVGFVCFGLLLGFVETKVFAKIPESFKTKYFDAYAMGYYLVFLILILILGNIPVVAGMINFAGAFFAMAVGAAINNFAPVNEKQKIRATLTNYFGMIGMPVIFMTVGAHIDLRIFTNPSVVLFLFIVLACSITIQMVVILLNSKGHTKNDIKYHMAAFLPKGVGLVNISLLIVSITNGGGSATQLSFTLAGMAILVTIPIGVTLMQLKGKEWLETSDKKSQ